MLETGTYIGGRYEILGKIGSGGMSDVYKARCHKLNRLVAIKVLKQEFCSNHNFVTRFKVEAQAAAKLTHANIVSIYDVGDEGDLHYIVMELVEGITLKDYIARKGRLESRETVGISIQIAQGLEAAHAQNIVHRDIKPQNIIISKEGKVKVMDFGIAKAVTGDTINSEAIGSVHYISPEQARGGFCDARSDIYSLGITMYEMLTGVVPFDGENTVSVALAHIQSEITPPKDLVPSIPQSLNKIVLKCTLKAPEQRYASATDLIADLRKALVMEDGDFVVLPAAAAAAAAASLAAGSRAKAANAKDYEDPSLSVYEEGGEEDDEEAALQGEYDEDYYDDMPDDEEDEDDKNDKPSTGDRVTLVISVILAIIILLMALYLIGRLTGFISGSQTEQPTLEEEETLAEGMTIMPSLIGLTEEEALAELNEAGLGMNATYEHSETIEEGLVMQQEYEEGEVIEKNIKIDVVISSGSNMIEIPSDILGMGRTEAENLLAALGLAEHGNTVNWSEQYSDTYAENTVCAMYPETGLLQEDDTLTLYVSLGPAVKNVTMVSVVGTDSASAQAQLSSLGLNTSIVEQTSSDVAAGIVISQSIDANTSVPQGSTVVLTVSTGKEAVSVPYVVGMTQSEAVSAMQEAGISYEVSTGEVTNPSEVGVVISQSLSAGTTYVDGTPMVIVVGALSSSGTLPSTLSAGTKYEDAVSIIESLQLDLVIRRNDVYDANISEGNIVGIEPAAGSTIARGSTVTITVSMGPEPTEAPAETKEESDDGE